MAERDCPLTCSARCGGLGSILNANPLAIATGSGESPVAPDPLSVGVTYYAYCQLEGDGACAIYDNADACAGAAAACRWGLFAAG